MEDLAASAGAEAAGAASAEAAWAALAVVSGAEAPGAAAPEEAAAAGAADLAEAAPAGEAPAGAEPALPFGTSTKTKNRAPFGARFSAPPNFSERAEKTVDKPLGKGYTIEADRTDA